MEPASQLNKGWESKSIRLFLDQPGLVSYHSLQLDRNSKLSRSCSMRFQSAWLALALMIQGSAFAAQELTFTNKDVNGVKIWEPSVTTLKAGEDIEIKVVNPLKDEHGFHLPGLTDPHVIPGNGNKTITVKAPKAGKYPYKCHMHPKHQGGDLTLQ
jgi:plastocyanin